MKTFPQYDATVRDGRRVTVTLTARSRCGDPINATARASTEREALARAVAKLAVRNAESAARCSSRGTHNHG